MNSCHDFTDFLNPFSRSNRSIMYLLVTSCNGECILPLKSPFCKRAAQLCTLHSTLFVQPLSVASLFTRHEFILAVSLHAEPPLCLLYFILKPASRRSRRTLCKYSFQPYRYVGLLSYAESLIDNLYRSTGSFIYA